jgi:hypothetical protein
MTQSIDHETCSRLLPSFLAGEAGEAAPAVTEHLRSCARCRAERAGLEWLLAPVEPPTETERASLRAVVREATFGGAQAPQEGRRLQAVPSGPTPSATRSPVRRSGGRRLWQRSWVTPALGTAAALLLIVGGISLLGRSTSGLGARSSAGVGQANGVAAPTPEGAKHALVAKGKPAPSFNPGHPIGLKQVSQRASSVLPALAHAYPSGVARSLGTDLLTRLTLEAPRSLRPQVRRCGGRVLDGDRTALPAFGAAARVHGQPALALVFSTAKPSKDSRSSFGLYAWARGSCRLLVHRSGRVP